MINTLTLEEMTAAVKAQNWIFAKTMPTIPHWYCLRRNFVDQDLFFRMVDYIKAYHVVEEWNNRYYKYVYIGEYKYWASDGKKNEADSDFWYSILINRAKHNKDCLE